MLNIVSYSPGIICRNGSDRDQGIALIDLVSARGTGNNAPPRAIPMLDQGLVRPFDTSYRPDIIWRGGSDGTQRNSLRLRSRVRVDDPLRAIPVLKHRLRSGWSPDGVVSYHPDVILRESCHPVQAIIFCNRIGAGNDESVW